MLSFGQFGHMIGGMFGIGRTNPNAAIQNAQKSAGPGMGNMANMFSGLTKEIGLGTVGSKSFTPGNLGSNPATANKMKQGFQSLNSANPIQPPKPPKFK